MYASYPEFLDAAAFAIDDPVMGDRIFAAVVPRPDQSPSLDSFPQPWLGNVARNNALPTD